MFYITNIVNFAEKFKLSPKFFLISRKVTFFCKCSHYFMGKKLRNCLFVLICTGDYEEIPSDEWHPDWR